MKKYLFSAGLLLAVGVACGVEVDIENKGCPCVAGYQCDKARNVCVRPGTIVVNNVTPDGGGPVVCDDCPCDKDEDCKDPTRPACNTGTKKCVECLPGPGDKCRTGTYCNAKFQCTTGCRGDDDCKAIAPATPICAQDRHQCVQCLTSATCGVQTCSANGVCVDNCTKDEDCTTPGHKCCNQLCLDVSSDEFNCGGCGIGCGTENGTPTCKDSKCAWDCASGFEHCAADNAGCETEVRSDPAHCGSCTNACTQPPHTVGLECKLEACSYTRCENGWGDFDGNVQNGCERRCGTDDDDECCPNKVCYNGKSCNPGQNRCKN